MNEVDSSSISAMPADSAVDRLGGVLDRFRVHADLFHAGPLCGLHVFEAMPDRAFLHVLRRGRMAVVYRDGGRRVRIPLSEPTALFFPRPLHHEFVNPPREGADFTCATLRFDGGELNPVVRSLPPLLAVPLAAAPGLGATLELLFSETAQPRCGSRLLAGRLFEVLVVQLLRWALDHPTQSGLRAGSLAGLAHPKLAGLLAAVHAAPAGPWSLARMAAAAGMSRSAFASSFREVVGSTPAAYALEWRLGLATAALAQGAPAKRVAADLGFADANALAKALRRRTGQGLRARRFPSRAVA